MLWLALHFPQLTLEALPLRQSPSVVTARGRVLAADPVAAAAGILPGHKLSTALGLLPGLRACERDPAREARALADLACWSGRFTPTVSLAPPAGLLLEIGGCRRLFGGIEAIVAAVLDGCRIQGWSVDWAVAPTPLGARWLARAGAAACYESLAALQAALADLPCAVPDWPAEVVARLDAFGLRRLGELSAQPAGGLRRRIGNGPVDDLLRACGELPDPQRAFVFPERFAAGLELPSRVEFAEGLAFAAQRLFAALAGWLQVRQSLLRVGTLQLTHDDGSSSALPLRFGEPCADEGRFMRLLREHLSRLQLVAPVEALSLMADELVARPDASAGLFEQAVQGEGAAACIERLRARLGDDAVRSLALHADHRPECASRSDDPAGIFAAKTASTATFGKPRPLWLLPAPQPLAERVDGPHWHGPLQLVTRGERLESGWWDSGEQSAVGDLRRDYFVARTGEGQWAWIFRDAQGWFLHGLFA
ncbi:protein ImuB [Azonexus fungiphilus]|uniref:Protein ImuB n=1 Tax=Azonexus fungiphilus TaxID=146940 RepID=A0A495WGI1_9RHOO|nr:DNA polymerase Y family protein [Azonexus fungiphilus]RKT60636.1 protein ImuB [Azonexus fungiphilus]